MHYGGSWDGGHHGAVSVVCRSEINRETLWNMSWSHQHISRGGCFSSSIWSEWTNSIWWDFAVTSALYCEKRTFHCIALAAGVAIDWLKITKSVSHFRVNPSICHKATFYLLHHLVSVSHPPPTFLSLHLVALSERLLPPDPIEDSWIKLVPLVPKLSDAVCCLSCSPFCESDYKRSPSS